MTHELLYTSVPRGLGGGTGYSTVAHTAGLPPDLADRLAALSRYRHLVKGPDPAENGNPVAFSHTVLTIGYRAHHVLSRVADTGFDHTDRSNYLAHHLVLGPDDLPAGGPAWVLQRPHLFETAWAADRRPGVMPAGRRVPDGTDRARKCKGWARATGDAGWGGVLAAATNPAVPVYILYETGQDPLPLIAEALALLPPADRWAVTFNTYFTGAVAGAACQWRCVPVASKEAQDALTGGMGTVLRVDCKMPGEPTGPLVEAARTGVVPEPVAVPPPPPPPLLIPTPRPEPVRPTTRTPEPRPNDFAALDLEPLPEDDAPPRPVRKVADGGSLRPLLIGLLLGLPLGLIGGVLPELATKRSISRHAGVVGRDESDLKEKVEGLERDATAAAKDIKDRDGKLAAKVAEWTAAERGWQKEKDDLKTALNSATDDAKNAKAAATKLDPLAKEVKDLKGTLLAAQKEARAAQDALGQLKKATAPPPVVLGPVVVLDLAKLDAGKPTVVFETGLQGEKLDLDVLGLPPNLKAERSAGKVVLTDPKVPDFRAVLTIDANGVVSVEGVKLGERPLLGLAVVVASPPAGPPVYRQLFRAAAVPPPRLPATGTDPAVKEYLFDWLTASDVPLALRSEARGWSGEFVLGSSARVRLDDREYDLGPGGEKNVLVSNPLGEPSRKVSLSVKDGKVVVSVTFPDGTKTFPPLSIQAVEVGRPVQGVGVQELFRIR